MEGQQYLTCSRYYTQLNDEMGKLGGKRSREYEKKEIRHHSHF